MKLLNVLWTNGWLSVILLLLMMLVNLPTLKAATDIETHGFLLLNATGRISDQRPTNTNSDFLLAEQRLRLDLTVWAKEIEVSARFKGDFFNDAVDQETNLEVREAYVDYTVGALDLRLGRQISTWGVGDLLFINDFSPKNWVSFFSGRPLEYLKLGVDGARGRYSSSIVNAELFIIPFFTPDNLPTTERYFYFNPFATVNSRDEQPPLSTYKNSELALRLYRRVKGFDISAYIYKGFWRKPGMRTDNISSPTQVIIFYSDLLVYGVSTQGNALGGVLSFEGGYYDSREDRDGSNPSIANSQTHLLVGYERQVRQDFSVGIQYYREIMMYYESYKQSYPSGFPMQRSYRDTVTLRIEWLLSHQTLRLSLFTFYSPVDKDYLIQPKASYSFSDELSGTLGANLFGGKQETTFLGQFDKNDNIFLSVRFGF